MRRKNASGKTIPETGKVVKAAFQTAFRTNASEYSGFRWVTTLSPRKKIICHCSFFKLRLRSKQKHEPGSVASGRKKNQGLKVSCCLMYLLFMFPIFPLVQDIRISFVGCPRTRGSYHDFPTTRPGPCLSPDSFGLRMHSHAATIFSRGRIRYRNRFRRRMAGRDPLSVHG